MNFKNLLSKGFQALSAAGSVVSITAYYTQIKTAELEAQNEQFKDQLRNFKIDLLKNDIIKAKLEKFSQILDESSNTIYSKVKELKEVKAQTTEQQEMLKNNKDIIVKSTDNALDSIKTIIDIIKDNSNKFLSDNNNIFELFNHFINNIQDVYSNLSLLQVSAITHIICSIFILVSIFNISSVLLSDFLIEFFKLEEKIPKLAKFFQFRKKLRNYYLVISFLMIVAISFALIFVDILVLI
uniref:Transmembrane protein n=1 Tax=Amanita bisporigera TaxID=87325 RepID=A0A5Q0N209_AMABI|nr:hypothetical protein [Amanita bisporigera]QFZ98545.1 hypothetical protein [Amanita bisporigera]